MKTNILRLSVLSALAASAVYGQSKSVFEVNVPFDFIVGTRTLQAGQYTVNQGDAQGMVIIKGGEPSGGAIVMGPALYSMATRNAANLVFHRYGDTYFLSEIWGTGTYGRQVRTTRQERELIARHAAHENTAVAAVR